MSHSFNLRLVIGFIITIFLFPNLNAQTFCSGGMAAGYPCDNIDLMSHVSLSAMGCSEGNDIWGWTDPLTNNEYAIFGCSDRTTFFDITDPVNPIFLGTLISHNNSSSPWRDLKVYNNHAYIVSEASGHGVQVFDLTQLRSVASPPATFSETAHVSNLGNGTSISNSHNIVINESTGFAYTVGNNICSGGLVVLDLSSPASPAYAGCFSADGYTHDAQCVIYNGPDATYAGKEICFNSNENTLTIVDVNNKSSMLEISSIGYTGNRYAHQGWLTDDHQYFLMNDELDESNNGHNTRTYIWDVRDLDNPSLIGSYTAAVASIDHNLYIQGDKAYLANYRSGLRILDISDIANGNLVEEGYFDIYPSSNSASFNGAWSNYPYFSSGSIIVSGIEQGLFVLQISGANNTCNNGVQDGTETGVDCGGICAACPTCNDGILNGNEIGVDCGGTCGPCPAEDCSTYDFTGNVVSYDPGGNDQGTGTVQNGGTDLFLTGNAWKAIPINYTITPNTVIEFDFKSTVEGEIHEMGFDNDLSFAPNHRYVFYGNQGYSGDYVNQTYTGSGNWEHFVLEVGSDFNGTFQYMVLVADDDASGTGNSYFRNITIYEDYNGNLACDAASNCEPEYTAANGNMLTGMQSVTADYETDGEIESNQIIGSLLSGNSFNVDYDSGTSILMQNGFEVQLGKVFHAFIDGCGGAMLKDPDPEQHKE